MKRTKKDETVADNQTQEILLPPDPERVMEGLRDTGYNFNTAIADIIDNSIAADASKIDVTIDLNPKGEVTVYVADNGTGMDQEGLTNAMKYGSRKRDDPGSLGKFGLGLKTASTAFCRCLSVVSRGDSDDIVRKVQWDLDYIAQRNEWSLRTPEVSTEENELLDITADGGTGTLVIWQKVDRLLKTYTNKGNLRNAFKKTVERLHLHIAMVYQRFLDPGDNRETTITISLNGNDIQAWDPFCLNEPATVKAGSDSIEVIMPDNKKAYFSLNAYVIPRRDEFSTPEARDQARMSNDMQGFYIYRENRLIHYGDWLGMFAREPHGSLLRVEFSFDHTLDEAFNVDIKKSTILLNEAIYDHIKTQFMPAPRRAAEDRYRKGTSRKVQKDGQNAHDASNKNIDGKANSVEQSKTTVTGNNEVQIENSQGTFTHKITVTSASKPGQYRVIPIDTLENGQLWEPAIVDEKHAVRLNQSHPYYKKVYYPVLSQNVMVTGMDALLWALAEAELSTFNEETKEQFEDMRFIVSRCLKKLVADLPDPDLDDDEDDDE